MFKTIAIGWLVLGAAAHADIVVKAVALTASNELNLQVTDAGKDLNIKMADLREGGPIVSTTQDPLNAKAQQVGDVVALMLSEVGGEKGQLELYRPSNGAYVSMLAKPIPDRAAGLDDDFAQVLTLARNYQWSTPDLFATMADYFQKNPKQSLFNFFLQLRNNRVPVSVAAPQAPVAPQAPAGPANTTGDADAVAGSSSRPVSNEQRSDSVPQFNPSQRGPSRPTRAPTPSAPVGDQDYSPLGGYDKPGGWLAN